MQGVVERIVRGSKTDAQYVLRMSIETLKNSKYTVDHIEDVKYKDNDYDKTRAKALAKLIACSKELSLRYLSMVHYGNARLDFQTDRTIRNILDLEQDKQILNMVYMVIKERLRHGFTIYRHKVLISLVISIPNFVTDNLDFFLTTKAGKFRTREINFILNKTNFKNITDKQFLKLCEWYVFRYDRLKGLHSEILSKVYHYGEKPIHYGLIEKLIVDEETSVIRVSACDLFTLMKKYPSRIELLYIRTPTIRKNEIGIEHGVAFIKRFFRSNMWECINGFLNRVEDISPFIHIFVKYSNDRMVQDYLCKNTKSLVPYLPIFVDLFLGNMNDFSLKFLKKLYTKYENKEEIKNNVMILMENVMKPKRQTVCMLIDMFDGDLPIKNPKVLRKCLQIIIHEPRLVQYLSPKYTEIMIKQYFVKGNVDNFISICFFDNTRKFDQLIVDHIIRSNEKSVSKRFWEIANSLRSKYAVEYAWIYGRLNSDNVLAAFNGNWITVPDDDVADKYLRYQITHFPRISGEVLAYFYNNTGCKIHIELIKTQINKTMRTDFVTVANILSTMVLKLNKIDHKEELRTILVRCALDVSEQYRDKDTLKRAIERLGGDECQILNL